MVDKKTGNKSFGGFENGCPKPDVFAKDARIAHLKPVSVAPAFTPGIKDHQPLKLRALARSLPVKK